MKEITDINAYRAQRATAAAAIADEPFETVEVPEWTQVVCLVTDQKTKEAAVMIAPPHYVMKADAVREHVIALLWSAIHARCESCRQGGSWCSAHATTPEFFAQIEKHVDAALESRSP